MPRRLWFLSRSHVDGEALSGLLSFCGGDDPYPKRRQGLVWIATDHTDMGRRMRSPALTVLESLKWDPHGGDLYIFRAQRRSGQDSMAWCAAEHKGGE